MAVFVIGVKCSLCGAPVTSVGDAVMFSPFVADRADPLFIFSDAVVHASCLNRHPLVAEAIRWHDEAVLKQKPSLRSCIACGRSVSDPDDYFATGLLARASDSPLYEFNFICLHASHAAMWPRFTEFRRQMEAAQAEGGAWQGPVVEFGDAVSPWPRWVARK